MSNDIYKEIYGEDYGENWYYMIPIIFIVAIIPTIVYGKVIDLNGDYFKYWNGLSQSLDFFSYYKALWFIVSVGLALIMFVVKLFNKSIKLQKNIIYIPMGIYSLMVILSTIFSDFKQISLFGFVERYEGMIIILSYMIILFITMNLFTNKAGIKAILIAIICSAIVIGTIGILQYLGHDIYKTFAGKKLILPAQYQSMASKIKFQFEDKIIYSTLYHYNYVGSYMAMLFPLTFTMFLFVKNKLYKLTIGLTSSLMFLNLILCHSRAGIIGGIVSMVILLIFARKFIIKNYKYFIVTIVIAIVSLVGFNSYSKGMLFNRIGSLFNDAESMTKSSNVSIIKAVTANNNELKIESSTNTLKVISNNGKIEFKNDSDNLISYNINKDNGEITLKEDKYKDYNINFKKYDSSLENKYELKINKSSIPMSFLIYNNKFSFIDEKGKTEDIKPIEKWGFEGKETLGSSRAYIWSRGIPLLKHAIILGYGPDTFGAKFPQYDYVGKLKAYGMTDIFVDKAHNLYLQQAVNTGMISLIAFLAIFIIYFTSSIRLYFGNNFNDFYSIIGLAIFISVSGYLGAGFFNDSVVSVAPVFWVFLGLGMSVNSKLPNCNLEK